MYGAQISLLSTKMNSVSSANIRFLATTTIAQLEKGNPTMNPENIIRIEGGDLKWLQTRMESKRKGETYLLRICVEDGMVKFKFNEETWTLAMGQSEAERERST